MKVFIIELIIFYLFFIYLLSVYKLYHYVFFFFFSVLIPLDLDSKRNLTDLILSICIENFGFLGEYLEKNFFNHVYDFFYFVHNYCIPMLFFIFIFFLFNEFFFFFLLFRKRKGDRRLILLI